MRKTILASSAVLALSILLGACGSRPAPAGVEAPSASGGELGSGPARPGAGHPASCDALAASEATVASDGSCKPGAEACVAVQARQAWTQSIYCGGATFQLRPEAAKQFDAIDKQMVDAGCSGAVWSSCPPRMPGAR